MRILLPLLCVVAYSVSGCGDAGHVADEPAANVVYLCTDTQELVEAPPQATPAVNPATGKPTLLRALYCGKCKQWKPVPPTDAFAGNPLTYRCPKHDSQLTASGPREPKSE